METFRCRPLADAHCELVALVVEQWLTVHHGRMGTGAQLLVIAAASALAGACAQPSLIDIPHDLDRITYETQPPPFCGRCESTTWTALSDGRVQIERGYWAGDYEDWRTNTRVIMIGPEQYRRFSEALAPYRPQQDTQPDEGACLSGMYDQDGAVVRWREQGVEVFRSFDFGCVDDPTMNDVVKRAPSLLVRGR